MKFKVGDFIKEKNNIVVEVVAIIQNNYLLMHKKGAKNSDGTLNGIEVPWANHPKHKRWSRYWYVGDEYDWKLVKRPKSITSYFK